MPDGDANAPGMFTQSEPSMVQRILRASGWHDIALAPVTLTLRLGADAAEAPPRAIVAWSYAWPSAPHANYHDAARRGRGISESVHRNRDVGRSCC
jgi:hypothetical protein